MKQVMSLQYSGLRVTIEDGVGVIESALKTSEHNESDALYNASIDGVESLILALAMEGYDVRNAKFVQAVKTSVESCVNNF